jgi:gamma-aminobutyric acid receptor subunit beta
VSCYDKVFENELLLNCKTISASFDAISEVNMDYTITMYLNQYWRDERLAFNAYSLMMDNMDDNEYMGLDEEDAKDMITLSGDFAEKIWVPDTFFANDKNRFVVKATESESEANQIIFIKVSYTM